MSWETSFLAQEVMCRRAMVVPAHLYTTRCNNFDDTLLSIAALVQSYSVTTRVALARVGVVTINKIVGRLLHLGRLTGRVDYNNVVGSVIVLCLHACLPVPLLCVCILIFP